MTSGWNAEDLVIQLIQHLQRRVSSHAEIENLIAYARRGRAVQPLLQQRLKALVLIDTRTHRS